MNYIDILNPATHQYSKESNKTLLEQTYPAWKAITILDDKSIEKFTAIVNSCYYEAKKTLDNRHPAVESHTHVSTGGVYVLLTRKEERDVITGVVTYTDHMELMVTTCHTLK